MQRTGHVPGVKKVKLETANILKGGNVLEPLIPAEYHNLARVFSKKGSDMVLPH